MLSHGISGASQAERLGVLSAALPGWDLSRLIAGAIFAGLKGIEWAIGPHQIVSAASRDPELRAMSASLTGAGLTASALSVQDPTITLDRPQRLHRPIEVAVALGVRKLRVHAPQWTESDPASLTESVGVCAELCGASGLQLLLEVAPGTLIPSPELVRSVIASHPSEQIGALYDPGNMVIEGHLAPGLAVTLLGLQLAHVHVKNVSWSQRGDTWRWRHAGLHEGLVNWRAVFAALSRSGYSGWLSIDHLDGPADEALLKKFAEDARRLAGLTP